MSDKPKSTGAGKGDKQRPTDLNKFSANYEAIDWGRKKKDDGTCSCCGRYARVPRFGVWNITLQTWVRNEDGEIVVHNTFSEADKTLARMNDLKQLNPRYKNHLYEVKLYVGN